MYPRVSTYLILASDLRVEPTAGDPVTTRSEAGHAAPLKADGETAK